MQIKLITYNIWHGKYLDKVTDFLKAEKADIVCLQEAATSGHSEKADKEVNLFASIKQALGMNGEYRRLFYGDKGLGAFDMGVVILTRFPITKIVEFHYERGSTDEVLEPTIKDRYWLPRVMLGANLAVDGLNMWVFTTHHTITPKAGVTEHQMAATRKVKEYLKSYDQYILCGDMNTPYGNETYNILSDGLTDISNPTQPTLHPTIHPVGNKGYHVDYVFLRGERIKHVATRIPQINASDHLPVVVTLSTPDQLD